MHQVLQCNKYGLNPNPSKLFRALLIDVTVVVTKGELLVILKCNMLVCHEESPWFYSYK